MGERDYIYIIPDEPGNRIRYRIMTEAGQVVDFVVQYEALINGVYYPVVRYDGSHGQGHRDILDARGDTVDKWWLPDHMDLKDSLNHGSADLRANWRRYRDTFLERFT